ncbi:hypothetical protein HUJ04_003058 [Dendroctonus ponderosae]|nr:hypothetical protein HUJ04_003058 [Dendroctonus ponderosae]KAH1023939.1 hypothetical protein HUJ05_003513 [Dendroctonus ponderosae]
MSNFKFSVYFSLNLYELIKKNNYQGFSLNLIRRFASSLLKCLRLLEKENIIHCDLKPENVLLKQRGSSSIKVIDFGSSCYSNQRVYTYIQSRFYRSPEVILGLTYGTAIDMWSLGCILAELYTGYPLFPGENEVEQLACLMEVLGAPPDDLISAATRKRLFFGSSHARQMKSGELRHSHSEVNVANDSHSSSSSISGGSHPRPQYKCSIEQDPVRAKIITTFFEDGSTHKLDSNLNDSGTFLPPLL